jgi:hypothetical protein
LKKIRFGTLKYKNGVKFTSKQSTHWGGYPSLNRQEYQLKKLLLTITISAISISAIAQTTSKVVVNDFIDSDISCYQSFSTPDCLTEATSFSKSKGIIVTSDCQAEIQYIDKNDISQSESIYSNELVFLKREDYAHTLEFNLNVWITKKTATSESKDYLDEKIKEVKKMFPKC